MGREDQTGDFRTVYDWMAANGVDEWLPEGWVAVTDDKITYVSFRWEGGHRGWDSQYMIVKDGVAETEVRTVPLVVPPTDEIREAFLRAGTLALIERNGVGGLAENRSMAAASIVLALFTQEPHQVTHARRELDLCGQSAEDPAYAESILAAIAGFCSYDGHSGGSWNEAVRHLTILLNGGVLAPLTDDPDEWFDHGDLSGGPLWQNRRCSAAFSGDHGKTYHLVSDDIYVPHVGDPIGTYGKAGALVYRTKASGEPQPNG